MRDLRARESPGHCQPRYITAPRKEITIDPTALLPMLFAGTAKDSRASWAPTRLACACTRWPDQHPLAATRPRERRLCRLSAWLFLSRGRRGQRLQGQAHNNEISAR